MEWKNMRHSKSGNKMCVTRREGIVFLFVEMTKHERIISMFEIGRPSGQRCQVEGRNRIEGGNGKRRQQQQQLSSSSDAPLLLLLEPSSQKLTEIWRKNFKPWQ